MFTKAFALATLERAIKTFAQSAVGLLVAEATGLLDVDWAAVGSVAGLASLISVLTSIGSASFNGNNPSLASETLDPK